ncbi:MAG: hypothetical protein ABWZ02_12010 [Nakamurella sp.]
MTASLAGGTANASAPSDSGWQPVGTYDDLDFPGCGTTLTVHDVVNKVESRLFDDGRGNTLELFRGKYIVQVSDPKGRKVVLDNSGPFSVAFRSNGDNVVTVLPPALIFPQADTEPAAFQKAGLPDVFYYTKGILNLVTKGGAERVATKPANPVNVCTLLR